MPPILCRQGEVITPRVEGIPAGLLEGTEYDEVRLETQPGDVILLYSDGVQDQPNPKGEEYENRLPHLLRKICHKPPREIVDAILADLDAFTEDGVAFDDQTIIAMKVL